MDIYLEVLRAAMIAVILWVLFRRRNFRELSQIEGWRHLTMGFALVFWGSLIDITDNFEGLNQFVIIGNTPAEAFLEKVVGYLFGYTFLALGILRWLPKVIAHNESIKKDLQQANIKVKILSGFLPICASCKKIRNDAGYWTQIEAYIREHSEAEFSHSICPECMKKLYATFPVREGEGA